MARHLVFPCKHADYALRCARTDTFQGSPLIFIMQVLFYPTAIGSEPQDPTLNSYPHWTRVMCGHAGANLVRHSSLSRNKSVTCRYVTRLHPLYMQQCRFNFACASKVCRGNFVLCWADKVIDAQRISIRATKKFVLLLSLICVAVLWPNSGISRVCQNTSTWFGHNGVIADFAQALRSS